MKKNYLSLIFCFTFFVFNLNYNILAQTANPFNCVEEAYLFQANDVYSINLASGSAILDGMDVDPSNINGVGYNRKDGFIWGSLNSPANTIIRIGENYEATTYTLPSAPFAYVGDIDENGIYYLKNGSNSFYKIDLDPASASYLTHIGSGTLSQSLNVHDWAFNAVDNKIYTVEKSTNILYRIDATTGNVESLGVVPILTGLNYTYGAVYFDNAGNFYVSSNQTGTIYVIFAVQDITTSGVMTSNLFAYGPSSSSNDGARCPTAPVPMEDCTNGIDDDGDGLVDCDDPSCSGVASCPTYSATSSGDEGGLESNNRLGNLINQRNFNRAKSNYKFDIQKARRIEKDGTYAVPTKSNRYTLWDFAPIDVLSQTTAIESSPRDLIDITNAVDVIAVDYMRNGENIGSLLALETVNNVYEHTKYICDRFTGAELLSVSNMYINDNSFIKSVVKKPDGSVEFVGSFSIRLSDDQNSFISESHWNLDQYTSNKDFYNFQVWTSTLDDLYRLSEEIIRLIEIQKPISEYLNSEAPPVFIKKIAYKNEEIHMEVVNTNNSTQAYIEGYKRNTETGSSEFVTEQIELNSYINTVVLSSGALYDFGFRLHNENDVTPDDIFVSDGTWGIDYSSAPYVTDFEVSQNENQLSQEAYVVERNITFNSLGNQDISVYRSLTPKFEAVDVTGYENFSFTASGNGELKVTFMQAAGTPWEEHPYAIVDLDENLNTYTISKEDITTYDPEQQSFGEVTMLLFTLVSNNGTNEEKHLSVKDVNFNNDKVQASAVSAAQVVIAPNPVKSKGIFTLPATHIDTATLQINDILGKQVLYKEFKNNNTNTIEFDRNELKSGIYIYTITTNKGQWKGKFTIN